MRSNYCRQSMRIALRYFSTKSLDSGMHIGSYVQQWPIKKFKNLHSTSTAKSALKSNLNSCLNLNYLPKITPLQFTAKKTKLKYRNVKLDCTNCKRAVDPVNHVYCKNCGLLLKPNKNYDFYQLYQLDSFFVTKDRLQKQKKLLRGVIAKHSQQLGNEENTAQWYDIIDDAYSILHSPIRRAQYRLKEHGIVLPKAYEFDASYKLLGESIQADISRANSLTGIKDLYDLTQKEIEEETKIVAELMEAEDYKSAINSLVKIRFLEEEIERPIKIKWKKMHTNDMARLAKRRLDQQYSSI